MILNRNALDNLGGNAADYLILWINYYAADLSGNGRTVTLNGSPVAYKNKDGSSTYLFDGNTKNFTVSSHADLALPADFTAAMWVRCTSLGDYPTLFCSTTDNANFYSYITATTCVIRLNNDDATLTKAFSTNTWYHIVFVRSGSTVTFYVNGTNSGIDSSSGEVAAANLLVGAYYTGSAYDLSGFIRHFMLFKGYAMTAGQVKALYDATYIE